MNTILQAVLYQHLSADKLENMKKNDKTYLVGELKNNLMKKVAFWMGLEQWDLTDDIFQEDIPDGGNLISKRHESKKA